MGPNSVRYTLLISKIPQLPTSILQVYCCLKSCFAMYLGAAILKLDSNTLIAQAWLQPEAATTRLGVRPNNIDHMTYLFILLLPLQEVNLGN